MISFDHSINVIDILLFSHLPIFKDSGSGVLVFITMFKYNEEMNVKYDHTAICNQIMIYFKAYFQRPLTYSSFTHFRARWSSEKLILLEVDG